MNASANQTIISNSELQDQLELLASIEATDVAFLSCYLDLRQGKEAALEEFSRLQNSLRKNIHESETIDFDNAVKMTMDILTTLNSPAQSVAIFCRGILGGQFMLSLPLGLPIENRVSFKQMPDIFPLVNVHLEQGYFLVATIANSWMQVSKMDLGTMSARQWATISRRVEADSLTYQIKLQNSSSSAVPALALHIARLKQLLHEHKQAYLVLNSDPVIVEQLRAGLPGEFRKRLVELPADLQQNRQLGLVDASRLALKQHMEELAANVAAQLISRIRYRGDAVIGLNATLASLHRNLANTLVMVKNIDRQASCWDCSNLSQTDGPDPENNHCVTCGPQKIKHESPFSEILRLAMLNHIPIYMLPEDHELATLGGVGCLLGQNAMGQVVLPVSYGSSIEQVA